MDINFEHIDFSSSNSSSKQRKACGECGSFEHTAKTCANKPCSHCNEIGHDSIPPISASHRGIGCCIVRASSSLQNSSFRGTPSSNLECEVEGESMHRRSSAWLSQSSDPEFLCSPWRT